LRRARLIGLLPGLLAAVAGAHPAPNSMLRLDIRATEVHAEYWLPASELAPARAADARGGGFADYLLRHLAAESPDGASWQVRIDGVRETTYVEHAYVVADVRLVPPAGASTRAFVLVDDAVTHEVRNHRVHVVARRDAGSDLIGILQYPARRLEVAGVGLTRSAQHAARQHDDGAQQRKHAVEGDSEQSERQ
jgi:hypothetical protein